MANELNTALQGSTRVSMAEEREHEIPLFAKRITEVPTNMQMRCDYLARTDGLPTYVGYAARGLSTSTTGWLIQKYTYDGNNQCTLRQSAYDTWDNRASATFA